MVCTHHSELGRCDSNELFKIIESIRPDIIFEELTQDLSICCSWRPANKFSFECILHYGCRWNANRGRKKSKQAARPDQSELEKKIEVLEKQLVWEKLRALALDTMITVAEREFNIDIRKKLGSKQSES